MWQTTSTWGPPRLALVWEMRPSNPSKDKRVVAGFVEGVTPGSEDQAGWLSFDGEVSAGFVSAPGGAQEAVLELSAELEDCGWVISRGPTELRAGLGTVLDSNWLTDAEARAWGGE